MIPLKEKPLTVERELSFYRSLINSLNCLKQKRAKPQIIEKAIPLRGMAFLFQKLFNAKHNNKEYFCNMSKVKIGLVQMSCTANKEENLQKAVIKVNEAAEKGAQIICLQELFTSLYFCDEENYDNFKLAESIPGPSTEVLTRAAKENQV